MENLGVYLVVLVVGALIGASVVCFISINQNSLNTEELKITSVSLFSSTSLIADVINMGSAEVTITDVKVTGSGVTDAFISSRMVAAGETGSFEVTIIGELISSNVYYLELISSRGNVFFSTTTGMT